MGSSIDTKQVKMAMKSVKVELNQEEYLYVSEQARKENISMRKYMKTKLLDTTEGIEALSDKIMRRLPDYYNLVNQVEDTHLKSCLMNFGGELYRILK